MPIIEVGAPKLGMSGGGFIDPRQAVEDAIKNETEAGLVKAISSVLGAVFTGTQKFEAKERADAVNIAQAQINQTIGLVKQGLSEDRALEMMASGKWAPEGFKENQPKIYQRLMDAGVGRIAPGIVSHRLAQDLAIQQNKTRAHGRNLTDLLENVDAGEEREELRLFMDNLPDNERSALEPYVEGIVTSVAIGKRVSGRARTRRIALDTASTSVTSHSLEYLRSFAEGTTSFDLNTTLAEFVDENLQATVEAGGRLKGEKSKEAIEEYARKQLTSVFNTLVAWEKSEDAAEEKSLFVIKFNLLQSALEGVRMGSRGNVDVAYDTLQSALSDPYWSPGKGEGSQRATFYNREATRANYADQGLEMLNRKKAAWRNATEADLAWAEASIDILSNLPDEITNLMGGDDLRPFIEKAMEWAGQRAWNGRSGQSWMESGDIDIADILNALSFIGEQRKKAIAAAVALKEERRAVTAAGFAGERAIESLRYDPDADPKLFMNKVQEAIVDEINTYIGYAEAGWMRDTALTSYRKGIASSYKTALKDMIPRLLASGEIQPPEGVTPRDFLENLAMQMNAGIKRIGSTDKIDTQTINAAVDNMSNEYLWHLEKVLGNQTPTSFIENMKRDVPGEVWTAVADARMSQAIPGIPNAPFTLEGTNIGELRKHLKIQLETANVPAKVLKEWTTVVYDIDEYERQVGALTDNPGRMYKAGGPEDLKNEFIRRFGLSSISQAVDESAREIGSQLPGGPGLMQSAAVWDEATDSGKMEVTIGKGGQNPITMSFEEFIERMASPAANSLGIAARTGGQGARTDVSDWVHAQISAMNKRRSKYASGDMLTPILGSNEYVQDRIQIAAVEQGLEGLKNDDTPTGKAMADQLTWLLGELKDTTVLEYSSAKSVASATLGKALLKFSTLGDLLPVNPEKKLWHNAMYKDGVGKLLDSLGVEVTSAVLGGAWGSKRKPEPVSSGEGMARQLVELTVGMLHGNKEAWPNEMRQTHWVEAQVGLLMSEMEEMRKRGVLQSDADGAMDEVIKNLIDRVNGVPSMRNYPGYSEMTVEDMIRNQNKILTVASEFISKHYENMDIGVTQKKRGQATTWGTYSLLGGKGPAKVEVFDVVAQGGVLFPQGQFWDYKEEKVVSFNAWEKYQDALDAAPEGSTVDPLHYGIASGETWTTAPPAPPAPPPIQVDPNQPPLFPPGQAEKDEAGGAVDVENVEGVEEVEGVEGVERKPTVEEKTAHAAKGAARALSGFAAILNGPVVKGSFEEMAPLRQILIDHGLKPGISRAFDPNAAEMTTWQSIWEFGPYDAFQIDPEWHNGAFLYRTDKLDKADLPFTSQYISGESLFAARDHLSEDTYEELKPFWTRIREERTAAGGDKQGTGYGMPRRIPISGVPAGQMSDLSAATAAGTATGAAALKLSPAGPGAAAVGGLLVGVTTYGAVKYLPQATLKQANDQYDAGSVTPAEVRLMVGFLSVYGSWDRRREVSSEFRNATNGDLQYMNTGFTLAMKTLSELTSSNSPSMHIEAITDD